MPEREVSQSALDHQVDEREARDTFGILELSFGGLFLTIGLYKFIPAAKTLMEASNYSENVIKAAQNDLHIASAFLLGAVVEVALSEIARGKYEERRQRQILQTPEPESTLAELVSGTRT